MPTASDLFCRKQESERVWDDSDFYRKSAEKFAVGFDVDSAVWRRLRFRQVLADSLAGVGKIDAGYLPGAAEERAGDIGKISETAGSSAEYEANVVAIQRRTRSEFPQYASEMADADSEKFRDIGVLRMVRTGFGILHPKTRHGIGEPEMPGFRIVGCHAQAMLGSGVELIEEVRVDPNPGGDDEVTRAWLPFEIVILNAAQGYTPSRRGESGLRGTGDIHGQAEVVGQCVSGAHGKNGQRDASRSQHLDDVVDRAIAAAGENGVTSVEHGVPGFFFSVGAGVREDEVGFDPSVTQNL